MGSIIFYCIHIDLALIRSNFYKLLKFFLNFIVAKYLYAIDSDSISRQVKILFLNIYHKWTALFIFDFDKIFSCLPNGLYSRNV